MTVDARSIETLDVLGPTITEVGIALPGLAARNL